MNDIGKAIELFKNHDTVTFKVTGCGEESYKTIEFEEIIQALEKELSCGWIPFESEYDEELKMNILQGKIPNEEQVILVTNGFDVWMDISMRDGEECYLDSGEELVSHVKAWMPLPEPYKEVEDE